MSDSEENERVFELVDETSISSDDEDEKEEVVNDACKILDEKCMVLHGEIYNRTKKSMFVACSNGQGLKKAA